MCLPFATGLQASDTKEHPSATPDLQIPTTVTILPSGDHVFAQSEHAHLPLETRQPKLWRPQDALLLHMSQPARRILTIKAWDEMMLLMERDTGTSKRGSVGERGGSYSLVGTG
ncbi:uncharacterized protein BCR38DRAFT_429777 [Pseudomassariella vexata]|uniref:Uncharacterized protein n=1 Tax=Pseudomassariella vexata TaxID=1141098 RepID=A0A1Y2E3Z9_9PEZI|nr:uncharacterized protein BCR38DRAFT_429777 [Pseudomassariella vexata]ORY66280.1 hypothetical protein BCR38DRAFT_429777 [Pseudomassariella vexata]